ncbi:Protein of unknown function [Pyronema omphalodes CBS 100304]|uniref:Uncharacterized protein n=1 Tax=Pyronema omphalodes (strain CBS 100304) TaxID=1076935 RepID=U4L2Z0_PYROM|nr:Protein of unknown function [Pyronema omphalodes CBS 100304]
MESISLSFIDAFYQTANIVNNCSSQHRRSPTLKQHCQSNYRIIQSKMIYYCLTFKPCRNKQTPHLSINIEDAFCYGSPLPIIKCNFARQSKL